MRKRNLLLGMFALLCSVFVTGVKVEASQISLKEYPGINIVDSDSNTTNIIPADYSTVIRPSYRMSYTVVGDDSNWKERDSYANYSKNLTSDKERYLQVNNAGIYHGEYIDLRVIIVRSTGSSVRLYTPKFNPKDPKAVRENFLRVNAYGDGKQTVIKYEFLKHGTEEHVDFSGTWNYRNINKNKTLTIDRKYIKSLYTHYNSEILFTPENTTQLVLDSKSKSIESGYDPKYNHIAFSMLFDTINGEMGQIIDHNLGTTYTKYDFNPIAQMELPTPQVVGETTETPKIEFTAIQDMPQQLKDGFYPKTYSLFIQLKDANVLDWNASSMEVYDASGETGPTIQNYFTYNRDIANNQLVVSANESTLKNPNFVDNAYEFQIKGKLKDNADLRKYYKSDGYYHVPVYVKYITNTNTSPESKGFAKIKAEISATPITQKVPQYSNTSQWKNKPISELFENMKGAYDGDDLVIESVENKTFNTKGPEKVKVTLKGSKSGITREYEVPVNVMEEKTATLHFIDQDGQEISTVETEKGFEGDAYDFSARNKPISNYTYIGVDGKGSPATGTYGEAKTIDIYFKYQLNDQKVTVNYVDSKGKPIANPTTTDYKPNKSHTIDSVIVPGYQVSGVKVDGNSKTLTEGKVTIDVKDKPMTVTFTYKSIHFSLDLSAKETSVSPRGNINYTLKVKSGMSYPEGTSPANYNNVEIVIPMDTKIANVSNIKVLDGNGVEIGQGEYKNGRIVATLTQNVKDTDDIKLTYTATVNNNVQTGELVNAKATMKATYQVNGEEQVISYDSNEVDVPVKASDEKSVKIHYVDETGKEISKVVTKVGYELQDYDYNNQIIDISGYKFIKVDEEKGLPIEGTFKAGNDDEDIYLVYKLAEFGLTVNYVDEAGAKISAETTKKVISGNKYTIESAVVPGYKVKSVKIDGVTNDLIDESKVEIKVSDKAIAVEFTYESVHFDLKLDATPKTVSRRGTIKYVLDVTSGMVYPEGKTADNYEGVEISIPVDSKIDDIKDIKVINKEEQVIGTGTFDKASGKITATLTKAVKNTEAVKVTYTATVNNSVNAGDIIKTQATMKAKYNVNGSAKEITGESNEVNVVVKSSEQKTITIHYQDEKGKDISSVTSKLGSELQDYNYEADIKTIPGYKFKEVDTTKGLPIKGTFKAGNEDEDIYVIYEHDELNVTVNYQDEDGNKISPELVKKYLSGKDYTISSLAVPGYKIKSVKVDGIEKEMSEIGKIVISVKDKAVGIVFTYESVQYSLKLGVDKANISQGETLGYTLDVTSGMVYPEGKTAENYSNVSIAITIDERLTDVSDIQVLDSKDKKIGIGQYDADTGSLKVTLTDTIKNTENIKVTYKAKVKDDAKTDDVIEGKATMKATYQVNGEDREISRESNKARTTIAGGLKLVSRPETIDFGKVTYQAKNQSVDNPTINDRLVVSDTRSNSTGGWQLSATLEQPLSLLNGERLSGDVIYKIGDKELSLSSQAQPIYTHQVDGQSTIDVTDTWGTTQNSDGVKLKFKSTDRLEKGNYSGKIRWTLMAGQP